MSILYIIERVIFVDYKLTFFFKVKVEPQRKESPGKKTRTASVTEKSKGKPLISPVRLY